MKTRSTNKLASSPHYARILREYTKLLKRGGKVNNRKFYREVILPILPGYAEQSWYQYLGRYRSRVELMALQVGHQSPSTPSGDAERDLELAMMSNEVATQRAINIALNLGARFFEVLWVKYNNTPELLTPFEQRVMYECFFKAMKAQDSRIHAIGKIKEDSRQEEKFERAFEEAAYGER